MKKTILFLPLFFLCSVINGQFLKPENLTDRLNNSSSVELEENFGFSSDKKIPSSFSLEKYAIVSKQNGSSCTGFAISSAMTIMYSYINKIDNYPEMLINRFDPFYFYAALKDMDDLSCVSNEGCQCGSYIYEGLDIAQQYGAKKWYLSPDFTCSSVLSKPLLRQMSFFTGIYKIDSYTDLLDYEKVGDDLYYSIDIEKIKYLVSGSLPIIAAISVGEDFGNLKGVRSTYSGDKVVKGGHAITIVGYDDDYPGGGAFRILNSYGSDWGDDGFFWMTYDDFKEHGSAAYVAWVVDDLWESWSSGYDSDVFYKGEITSGNYWEGPMNEDGMCHGRGILVGDGFSAYAYYYNGSPQGEWYWYSHKKNGFWGSVFYDNGEVVGSEEWGFSSNKTADGEIKLSQIENMSVELGEEATENDLSPKSLESILKAKK